MYKIATDALAYQALFDFFICFGADQYNTLSVYMSEKREYMVACTVYTYAVYQNWSIFTVIMKN